MCANIVNVGKLLATDPISAVVTYAHFFTSMNSYKSLCTDTLSKGYYEVQYYCTEKLPLI